METDKEIEEFLLKYDNEVFSNAKAVRKMVLANLPDIMEQIDVPAKMIAYCYGQKYAELICVIIPSKRGLKLGFNRGVELSDPHHLLEGTTKISRYIQIKSPEQINAPALKEMLSHALELYRQKSP